MNKSNFDHLLKRYLTGKVSEQERAKIDSWLDTVKTEGASDVQLSDDVKENLFQKITSKHDNLTEIRSMVPWKKKITFLGWTLRLAATILVVFLTAYIGWKYGYVNNGSIEIASDSPIKKVILTDGSIVWLKGKSKLIYYKKEKENIRYAELKGEGLFEVAKDATQPFMIDCGKATLKVLGTSFSVKTNGDSLEVLVLTGKVNVSIDGSKENIDILPNEKMVFGGTGLITKAQSEFDVVSGLVQGTEYNMQFSNASLGDIVEQLHRKFDIAVSIQDSDAKACTITVDLTDQSLENALAMITEVLDVQYQFSENTVAIIGPGCK